MLASVGLQLPLTGKSSFCLFHTGQLTPAVKLSLCITLLSACLERNSQSGSSVSWERGLPLLHTLLTGSPGA